MAIFLSILTFFILVAIFVFLWLVMATNQSQEVIRNRMEAVRKAERRGNVSLAVDLVRDEMLSSVPALNRALLKWSWATGFRDFVLQAGIETRPGKIVLISAVASISSCVIAQMFFRSFIVPLLIAIGTGVLPFIYIAWKRKRRFEQFEEHFPEALDLLGRAVRAGHAFTTGLEMITKESAEPIAGEFRSLFEEQNFGLPLRDAMLNLTERVPLVDVRFFVTALLIQKETGGNLAEILDGLSRVIRDRFRIYRDVKTKTAQGKLTAGILLLIPPFMLFALGSINPEYMKILYTDPLGPRVLIIAAILQIVGAFFLWRIIDIEV